jgi:AcrR family transcriptional regulator
MDIISRADGMQLPPATADQASGPEARGGAETRRRLLESAVEVFAERGYHAATLSEIASRAGLTTGAVYSTFGSKKALLVAVCTQPPGSEDADLDAALARGASLREALEALALDAAREGPSPAALRQIKLQLELLKLGLAEPELLAAVAATGQQQLAAATRLIEARAHSEGVALPMPAAELATLLSALLNGLALIQLVDPDIAPESLFLRGVRALMGWTEQAGRTEG